MRGLLPAASLSHVGIFASGQAYEQLLMRLLGSPLPEAREFGELALDGAAQGDPGVPEAGRHAGSRAAWIEYLARCARAPPRRPRASASPTRGSEEPAAVHLLHADGSEEQLLTALLYEASDVAEEEIHIDRQHDGPRCAM